MTGERDLGWSLDRIYRNQWNSREFSQRRLPTAATDGNNNYISRNYCTRDSSAVRASRIKELGRFFLSSPFRAVFFQTNKSAQIHPYYLRIAPCIRRKLRAGLWPYTVSGSENWNFRKSNFSREIIFFYVLHKITTRNSQSRASCVNFPINPCGFARLNKSRRKSVPGLNHNTRRREQNADYLHPCVLIGITL